MNEGTAGPVRELHVVAVSEDGRHVLLAGAKGAKSGSHRIALDARLIAAVRGDLRAVDSPVVDLSPKEIQARLRAGESAEAIARSAGVAITRVERFAGPVAGEMARTLDAARQAFVVRGRRGRSLLPLGTALGQAVAATGQPESLTWETRRAEDGRWRVAARWSARGRQRTAAWWFVPGSTDLVADDPASAALGHVDADTGSSPAPKATPKPPQKPAQKRSVRPAVKQAKALQKPTPPKAAAKSAAPTKSASTTSAKTAPVKSKPVKSKPVQSKPVKSKQAATVPGRPAARTARPRLQVVPDAPARRRATAATNGARATEGDGVKSRASVPGWADVLLGTSPGGER
jgi:hypothetical protein